MVCSGSCIRVGHFSLRSSLGQLPSAGPTYLPKLSDLGSACRWSASGSQTGRWRERAIHLLLLGQAWLCGGSVEILPCSRVGHIYQSQEASSRTDPEVILRNKIRVAETWLASFKETFYRHIPEAFALSKVRRLWWGSLSNISRRSAREGALPYSWLGLPQAGPLG